MRNLAEAEFHLVVPNVVIIPIAKKEGTYSSLGSMARPPAYWAPYWTL